MLKKVESILGSVRFWQLAGGVVLLILAYYSVIPQELANLIAGALGISITIGTIDKVAGK
jgi:hypothetical protein